MISKIYHKIFRGYQQSMLVLQELKKWSNYKRFNQQQHQHLQLQVLEIHQNENLEKEKKRTKNLGLTWIWTWKGSPHHLVNDDYDNHKSTEQRKQHKNENH